MYGEMKCKGKHRFGPLATVPLSSEFHAFVLFPRAERRGPWLSRPLRNRGGRRGGVHGRGVVHDSPCGKGSLQSDIAPGSSSVVLVVVALDGRSPFFNKPVREIVADFAPTLGVATGTFAAIWARNR